MIKKIYHILIIVAAVVAINMLSQKIFVRLDLTSEKRFTLSEITRSFLSDSEKPIFVRLYLDGDLNPGFARLKKSTLEILDELDVYAASGITYTTIDPATLKREEGEALNGELDEHGYGGVPVFEAKEDGTKTRTIVYPYAMVQVGDRYTWVNLLENIPGLSGDENLNRSVENLEFKIIDGIRRVSTDEKPRIAFLEGHGELDEIDVVEATDALSEHFVVDRGQIGDDASILDPYKVIIVAKPAEKFSEKEKYIIDQYFMRGGRVLWLVDAVTMTLDSLRESPHTVGLLADFNLDDMLFIYGVRINPEVVEDINCGMVPISVAQQGEGTKLVPMPWRYSPLLSTNMASAVTRNVNLVKGDFASYIDTVGENLQLKRTVLLRTSAYTKANRVPVFATLANIHEQPLRSDFNRQFLDVALLQEGYFSSAFAHRNIPTGIVNAEQKKQLSSYNKMIVVADGDIIRNDVRFRLSANPTIVPLGYDEISRQTFGNKDFIVNAVQYLADDDGWMSLRNRTFTLRLLDKEKIGSGTTQWKTIALAVPLLLLSIGGATVVIIRRRKYGKRHQ